MLRMDAEDWWRALGLVFTVIVVVAVIVGAMASAATHRECLRLGYPRADLTVFLERYCVTRVDQTDLVVPLAEATEKPR